MCEKIEQFIKQFIKNRREIFIHNVENNFNFNFFMQIIVIPVFFLIFGGILGNSFNNYNISETSLSSSIIFTFKLATLIFAATFVLVAALFIIVDNRHKKKQVGQFLAFTLSLLFFSWYLWN